MARRRITAAATRKGYYAERMWIPCVMLDAAAVGEALAAGQSFRQRVIGNEMPQWPWLSKLLCLRFRIPGLRALALDGLRTLRREYRGVKPHYIYCDTGADLHDYFVRNRRGLAFADLGAALVADGRRAPPRRDAPPAASVDAQCGRRRHQPDRGRRAHRENLRREAAGKLTGAAREFSACA